MTFLDAASEKTLRSTLALTASRGRGKSAALGLAIAGGAGAGRCGSDAAHGVCAAVRARRIACRTRMHMLLGRTLPALALVAFAR